MVVLDRVREQYEELPYPPRNPEDERERLISNQPSQLLLANHLFWGGRRTIDSNLRVLDAGCGTGDSTICMAEQLRDTGARVTALDFSSASLAVTRRRAEVRGLDNIDYVEAPLEELPRLGVGEFDFILSSGVLHHLASPEQGLEALRAVLKPDGGIAVMVYSRYGRAPLYLMQELMRRLAPPSLGTEERLRVLKRTLKLLHDDHPLKETWDQHGTEAAKGDAALFDMFLHAQDRAYTVPEIYEWVEGAELRILTFDAPRTYEPKHYDDRIDVSALPAPQRHAVAELLHARMGTHIFYATHRDYAPPAPPDGDDETAVPCWSYVDFTGARERALLGGKQLNVQTGRVEFKLGLDPITRAILQRVDGKTPLGAIIDAVDEALPAVKRKRLQDQWRDLYRGLRETHVLLLNHPA